MQQYDIAAKVLIEACRDEIIRHLLGLTFQESKLVDPLPQETVSVKRSDFPILITDAVGGRRLVVLEIQTLWRKTVPLHLIDYRVRHLLNHEVDAVTTCVILLRPSPSASDFYEDDELRFRFQLIKIYEMDARTVVEEGPVCMLPFVPLMKNGNEFTEAADELIYGSEWSRPVKADMPTSMAILSGLVSWDAPAKLIARRRDIMIESAAYDIIKNEGVQEGLEKGVRQGLKDSLATILRVKFGAEGAALQAQIEAIEDVQNLRSAIEDIERAGSPAEARRFINGLMH